MGTQAPGMAPGSEWLSHSPARGRRGEKHVAEGMRRDGTQACHLGYVPSEMMQRVKRSWISHAQLEESLALGRDVKTREGECGVLSTGVLCRAVTGMLWPVRGISEEEPAEKTEEGCPERQGKPGEVGDTAAGKPASRRKRSSASDAVARSGRFPCAEQLGIGPLPGRPLHSDTPQAPPQSPPLVAQFHTKPAWPSWLSQSLPEASMELRNSGPRGGGGAAGQRAGPGLLPLRHLATKQPRRGSAL